MSPLPHISPNRISLASRNLKIKLSRFILIKFSEFMVKIDKTSNFQIMLAKKVRKMILKFVKTNYIYN